MKCPSCNNKKSSVTNSRLSKLGNIRRRRECAKCGERFTTYELDILDFMIYLEDKMDVATFSTLEKSLLEDFPISRIDDRIIQGTENLKNHRLLREKNLQQS
jgi:transcriptional regulator NrdR family protein